MRAAGESAPTIAQALGVSRATLYRALGANAGECPLTRSVARNDDPRLSPHQKASVIAHELGHVHAGHVDAAPGKYRHHRGQMETEARPRRRQSPTSLAARTFDLGVIPNHRRRSWRTHNQTRMVA